MGESYNGKIMKTDWRLEKNILAQFLRLKFIVKIVELF